VVNRTRKRVSSNYLLNCLCLLIYLLLRKRITKIVYIDKRKHFIGVTNRGNLIHFHTTGRLDRWQPFLFEGYVEVMKARASKAKHSEFTTINSLIRYFAPYKT
jgi:hypothetical protein